MEVVTPEEIEKITKEVKVMQSDMDLDVSGEIQAETIQQLAKAVKSYRAAGLIPQHLKTDGEAVGAILFAKQLQLPALSALGQIACIHGKFSVFGSLFTALAQRDPDFGYDEVFYINEEGKKICYDNGNLKDPAWGCIVRTQRKGSPFVNEYSFTMDEAKKANLIRNVWNTYPKALLFAKAIARSYRGNYSAALNGVHLYDDLKSTWEPEEKEVGNNADTLKSFLEE